MGRYERTGLAERHNWAPIRFRWDGMLTVKDQVRNLVERLFDQSLEPRTVRLPPPLDRVAENQPRSPTTTAAATPLYRRGNATFPQLTTLLSEMYWWRHLGHSLGQMHMSKPIT